MKGKKKDKKKQMSEAEGSVDPRRALGMAKMREVYGFEADPANMEGRYEKADHHRCHCRAGRA
ncbi:MAG: hypothetical protein NT160_05075 [Actinobacteria bacterium]|nr:hypothetical protein [Actinomycetota bacterium]